MAIGYILLATVSGGVLGCFPIMYFTLPFFTWHDWAQGIIASSVSSAVGASGAWYFLMRGRDLPGAGRTCALALLTVAMAGEAPVVGISLYTLGETLSEPERLIAAFKVLVERGFLGQQVELIGIFVLGAPVAALIFCGIPGLVLSYLYFWSVARWRKRSVTPPDA